MKRDRRPVTSITTATAETLGPRLQAALELT